MFEWLKRRAETNRRAEKLYGSVVTAARQRFFYKDVGVPDTPEGRFELVALNLFLALEGLKSRAGQSQDIARRTIESFVADMDDCMREMGVGDLSVPKQVKRAAAAFYERAAAYRQGLAQTTNLNLKRALRTYVFAEKAASEEGVGTLADYVRAVATAAQSRPFEMLFDDDGPREPGGIGVP